MSVLGLLFVIVVVGGALSLMAWLLAGIPELQARPVQRITDLDADAFLDLDLERGLGLGHERSVGVDLDVRPPTRARESLCP